MLRSNCCAIKLVKWKSIQYTCLLSDWFRPVITVSVTLIRCHLPIFGLQGIPWRRKDIATLFWIIDLVSRHDYGKFREKRKSRLITFFRLVSWFEFTFVNWGASWLKSISNHASLVPLKQHESSAWKSQCQATSQILSLEIKLVAIASKNISPEEDFIS